MKVYHCLQTAQQWLFIPLSPTQFKNTIPSTQICANTDQCYMHKYVALKYTYFTATKYYCINTSVITGLLATNFIKKDLKFQEYF